MSDLQLLAQAIRLMKNPTEANISKARALMDDAVDMEATMIADLFDAMPTRTDLPKELC